VADPPADPTKGLTSCCHLIHDRPHHQRISARIDIGIPVRAAGRLLVKLSL
jgi:hypothetical protein